MAKDEAGQTGTTSSIEKGIGALERAWDAKWALQLTCLVLFADMAMMLHVGRGLWQWSAEDKALLSDVGVLTVALVGFTFTAAILLPIVLLVMRQFALIVWGWLPKMPTPANRIPYQRPHGYVFVSDFRERAFRDKDGFLFRMYETHVQARQARDRAHEKAGELTAATLLAALADWAVAHLTPGSIGLVGALFERLGDWGSIATVLLVLGAGTILKSS